MNSYKYYYLPTAKYRTRFCMILRAHVLIPFASIWEDNDKASMLIKQKDTSLLHLMKP